MSLIAANPLTTVSLPGVDAVREATGRESLTIGVQLTAKTRGTLSRVRLKSKAFRSYPPAASSHKPVHP